MSRSGHRRGGTQWFLREPPVWHHVICQGSASLGRTFGVSLEKRIFGSLLTTQESALSDLLRITSVVLFTPPDPSRDQTPEDHGLDKCWFTSYRGIIVLRTLCSQLATVMIKEDFTHDRIDSPGCASHPSSYFSFRNNAVHEIDCKFGVPL
jgi:hypothetical protein